MHQPTATSTKDLRRQLRHSEQYVRDRQNRGVADKSPSNTTQSTMAKPKYESKSPIRTVRTNQRMNYAPIVTP